jgi:hypothetical protein
MAERLADAILREKLWAALFVALAFRLGFALADTAELVKGQMGAVNLLDGKLPPTLPAATLLATQAGYITGEAGWSRVSARLFGRAVADIIHTDWIDVRDCLPTKENANAAGEVRVIGHSGFKAFDDYRGVCERDCAWTHWARPTK